MINFIEGQIDFNGKKILSTSNIEDLDSLNKDGLIEKRETGTGKNYYYVEVLSDGMRYGISIRLKEKMIEWLRLSWLDSSMKGWDDVSEKAMKDEYRLLSNFVETQVGRPADRKKNRQRTWCFQWGQVEVSYEPRSFQANIFIVPR